MAQRNAALGYSSQFEVLCLEGFDQLSKKYRDELKSLGWNVQDCSNIYKEQAAKYSPLNRFVDFERKCFLRWPVINAVFNSESVIHYDGDIVFNVDPKVIETKTMGMNFVLQGCPALTVINSSTWFDQYEQALAHFCDNIDAYSEKAWAERTGWEQTFHGKWAGSRFRKIISSDQDLMSHLIHTDRLVQTPPALIMSQIGDACCFENPLYFDSFVSAPVRYSRKNQMDFFNDNPILLWHIQSDFFNYLQLFMIREKYLPFLKKRNFSNPLEKKTFVYAVLRTIRKLVDKLNNEQKSRLRVYEHFFSQTDFAKVFSSETWWKKDVFQ